MAELRGGELAYFLGLDSGGTKTECWLGDETAGAGEGGVWDGEADAGWPGGGDGAAGWVAGGGGGERGGGAGGGAADVRGDLGVLDCGGAGVGGACGGGAGGG